MKKKVQIGKAAHHSQPKPHLRTRHLSSVGKSAYSGPAPAIPAFPPGPVGGDAGAMAFPDANAGGAVPAAAPSGSPGM